CSMYTHMHTAKSLTNYIYTLTYLQDGLKRADADPSVKAVMICGENGKFSAGKTFFIKHSPEKEETFSTHHLVPVWNIPGVGQW
uniref:Uncharacterized protein n=1 Tax=Bubo bubo TaxID=30461 RepID=A0A8C0F9I3_BUBBB